MSRAVAPLALFLVAACGDAAAKPYVPSSSCPLKTPVAWQRFLTETASDPTWVKTCSDLNDCSSSLGSFAERVERDVQGVLDQCVDDVAKNPRIAECTENLRRFLPAWHSQHSSTSYGFKLDNHAYLEAQTASDVPPGMMDPPPGILAALPDRSAIEDLAKRSGWPYLTHDSGLGGLRMFITVTDPADRFDQWFLFGVNADATEIDGPSIMSFLAVQKQDVHGNYLPKVRVHFRDYVVAWGSTGWALQLPEDYGGKCYACHASGVRQLISTRGSAADAAPVFGEVGFDAPSPPDFGRTRLALLNQRLSSYGVPDWGEALDPADHGPPLGGELGCTDCHDGRRRGVLTVTTSEGMLGQKMIEQLSMQAEGAGRNVPDDAAMALQERRQTGSPPLTSTELDQLSRAQSSHIADYQALVAERFPAWQRWLLAAPCASAD